MGLDNSFIQSLVAGDWMQSRGNSYVLASGHGPSATLSGYKVDAVPHPIVSLDPITMMLLSLLFAASAVSAATSTSSGAVEQADYVWADMKRRALQPAQTAASDISKFIATASVIPTTFLPATSILVVVATSESISIVFGTLVSMKVYPGLAA